MSDHKVAPPSYYESQRPGGSAVPSAFAPYTPGHPLPPNYFGAPPQPGYGATSTTVIITPPDVVVIGACPACRVGVLEDDFTALGLLCAILLFPLGILCCLAMREKRCRNCGAQFG